MTINIIPTKHIKRAATNEAIPLSFTRLIRTKRTGTMHKKIQPNIAIIPHTVVLDASIASADILLILLISLRNLIDVNPFCSNSGVDDVYFHVIGCNLPPGNRLQPPKSYCD